MLRKNIWPLRELVGNLQKENIELISDNTQVYLRDVYDHILQIMETIDTFREMLSVMFDIYLSSINNRMNETMKVLTLISTIFIPLSFIAGIYGMNFKNMPELNWEWGYFMVLGIMLSVIVGLLAFFRKKKWI